MTEEHKTLEDYIDEQNERLVKERVDSMLMWYKIYVVCYIVYFYLIKNPYTKFINLIRQLKGKGSKW